MTLRKPPLHQQLRRLEHDILKAIAADADLKTAMTLLCRGVEAIAPDVICSIIAVEDGALHPIAGPSLPDSYSAALDGLRIGPEVGACGTAAFRGVPVVARDLPTDPLWAAFEGLGLPASLHACWSSPIRAKDGSVAGTFAFYYRTPREARRTEQKIVDACVHLCAIAIEHDRARAHIERLAYRDSVTGLPNRMAFQTRALAVAEEVGGTGCDLTLHYVDLDDFKGVNDTLGHRVGDLLLRSIGERIAAAAANARVFARIGGDEFSVLQSCVQSADAEEMARRLLAAFDEPFLIEGHLIPLGASIGVAAMPAHRADISELMKRADLALYRAKDDGRGTFRFFVPEMSESINRRRTEERELRAAVDAGDFELAFQPILDLASDRITACEALIRWRHPTDGVIMPAGFIPLAEQIGLISAMGRWVLTEACRQAATWPSGVSVSVNLSAVELRTPHFFRGIEAALDTSGLPPERLKLEITESTFLDDNHTIQSTLRRLREMGIGLALDDFGTGYSSLRAVRSFPIDRIKIDQSFVHDLGAASHAEAIIRTVVALGRDLGMITTAEGVETETQLRLLEAAGCTEVQGYFVGRPVAAAEIAASLSLRGAVLQPERPRRKAAG